jgi:exonuclease VII large subunit
MMPQTTLADVGGLLTEIRDNQRQLKQAVRRCQRAAAYYQEQAERAFEAAAALKGRLMQQHQADLYHTNQDRFSTLRGQIYACFRDDLFPSWDPIANPHGTHRRDALAHALTHPWAQGMDSTTYFRRLNELADARITNPPLLTWKPKPGYYRLAEIPQGAHAK